jgi:hypothetical protein
MMLYRLTERSILCVLFSSSSFLVLSFCLCFSSFLCLSVSLCNVFFVVFFCSWVFSPPSRLCSSHLCVVPPVLFSAFPCLCVFVFLSLSYFARLCLLLPWSYSFLFVFLGLFSFRSLPCCVRSHCSPPPPPIVLSMAFYKARERG